MRNIKIAHGEYYHIFNRGMSKQTIFHDNTDRARFLFLILYFQSPVILQNISRSVKEFVKHSVFNIDKQEIIKDKFVELTSFCLMPNHFHLLLRQKKENSISKFMQKLGTGYTMYFNQKYERVGSLFQGRFKAILVDRQAHFIHLPFYIHLNPLEIYRGSTSLISTMNFLENYRWSSFPDYIGKKNFPSVTSREFLSEFFKGSENYKKEIFKWLKERNLEKIKGIVLE